MSSDEQAGIRPDFLGGQVEDRKSVSAIPGICGVNAQVGVRDTNEGVPLTGHISLDDSGAGRG
jgi:hypothetical protein